MGRRHGTRGRESASARDLEFKYFARGPAGIELRKEQQICKEAFEAIGLALAGLEDAMWLDVELVAVEPAPDASRLAVVVRASAEVEPARLIEKLEQLAGYLRAELAAAIHRKRVPALTFRLAGVEEDA